MLVMMFMMMFTATPVCVIMAAQHAMRYTVSDQVDFATIGIRNHFASKVGTFVVMDILVDADDALHAIGKSHQVVCHHHNGHAGTEFCKHVVKVFLAGSVDIIAGLIQEENAGITHQGACNENALAFAAAKLSQTAVQVAFHMDLGQGNGNFF